MWLCANVNKKDRYVSVYRLTVTLYIIFLNYYYRDRCLKKKVFRIVLSFYKLTIIFCLNELKRMSSADIWRTRQPQWMSHTWTWPSVMWLTWPATKCPLLSPKVLLFFLLTFVTHFISITLIISYLYDVSFVIFAAYHMERVEEPGVLIPLDSKLLNFNSFAFRLVFEESKYFENVLILCMCALFGEVSALWLSFEAIHRPLQSFYIFISFSKSSGTQTKSQ